MKLPRRRFLPLIASAAALPVMPRFAMAQTYPSRPIKLIVAFPAGGPADTMGRLVGQAMSSRIGQPVVIENIGGAGGSIALRTMASATSRRLYASGPQRRPDLHRVAALQAQLRADETIRSGGNLRHQFFGPHRRAIGTRQDARGVHPPRKSQSRQTLFRRRGRDQPAHDGRGVQSTGRREYPPYSLSRRRGRRHGPARRTNPHGPQQQVRSVAACARRQSHAAGGHQHGAMAGAAERPDHARERHRRCADRHLVCNLCPAQYRCKRSSARSTPPSTRA